MTLDVQTLHSDVEGTRGDGIFADLTTVQSAACNIKSRSITLMTPSISMILASSEETTFRALVTALTEEIQTVLD